MNPNIYLHEIIRTVPGREEPYMASVLSVHSDGARRRGEQAPGAFGQFRSAGVSGSWPGAINIWENTWSGLARDLKLQFQDAARDTAMEEWWNRNLHLRRGGYDRILIPAPFSPSRACTSPSPMSSIESRIPDNGLCMSMMSRRPVTRSNPNALRTFSVMAKGVR